MLNGGSKIWGGWLYRVATMAANTRTPPERERDRVRIEELYLAGYTHSAIALKIGVCRQQIGREIQKILGMWRDEMIADINEAKAKELKRVNALEREYMNLYRSKGAPETLARVQWCIDKRCQILGLNAPKVTAGRPDKPKPDKDALTGLSTTELQMIAAGRAVDAALGGVKGGSEKEPLKGGVSDTATSADQSTVPESTVKPESGGNTATKDKACDATLP